jgi:hypothetical protein
METRMFNAITIVNLNEETVVRRPEIKLQAIFNPELGYFEEKEFLHKINVFDSVFSNHVVSIVQKHDIIFISRKCFDGNIITHIYLGTIFL